MSLWTFVYIYIFYFLLNVQKIDAKFKYMFSCTYKNRIR